jgi:hypothetical protein
MFDLAKITIHKSNGSKVSNISMLYSMYKTLGTGFPPAQYAHQHLICTLRAKLTIIDFRIELV